jgi:hemoglobin/transferrin/lactoferrin receptor protein
MQIHKIFTLSILLFTSSFLWAQDLKLINQYTNEPVEGVLIETNAGFYKISNKKGIVNIDNISLNEKIFISHKSFELIIILKKNLPKDYTIHLEQKDHYLPEVNVDTPPLRGYINVNDEPHQIAVVTKNDILLNKPSTSADMLQNSGQVLIQKSQGGGGSPIMRGFEANKLLLVIDGVRMNNAIYRSGHLQNSITIDPSILEETEIIFGPNSVLYGSDALGGVIHFHTQNPQLADSTKWKTSSNISTFYDYQTGYNTNISTSIAQKKWGLLTSVSASKFTDYQMGKNRFHGYNKWGLDSNYVDVNNGKDTMLVNLNPNLQKQLSYTQIDVLSKLYYQPSNILNYTLNFQYSKSSNINRYDKLNEYKNGVLKYAEWYYGPQKRLFTSANVNFKPQKKWLNAGSFILSFQKIDEDRISRKFQAENRNYQFEDVYVFALNLDLNKVLDSNQILYYGVEVQDNIVNSTGFSKNIFSDEINLSQTRYPDGGSQYLSSGIYLEYKNHLSKKAILTSGLRYSIVFAKSLFIDTSFIQLPFQQVDFLTSAPSGNIGFIFQADKRTILKSSLSSGFRAPNVDDYGKVFEKKGNTVVPTNQLKPEYAINGELSAERIFGLNILTVGTSVYYTYLFNAIVRSDAQLNGLDSILYDGELTNVQTNTNTNQAQIYGLSAYFKWTIIKNLYFSGIYNFTKGIDLTHQFPLVHIAPQFGKIELMYKTNYFNTGLYSFYNFAKQTKDYGGSSDNIDEATIDGTPAWATLNYRFSYIGFKKSSFHLKVTNILDVHYKQFASAISAPGRSFMIGFKVKF